MFVLIGMVVVLVCVIGGFMMHEGPLAVLIQPNEVLIIVGAALGSVLVATPLPKVKLIVSGLMKVIKGDPYSKKEYTNLLKTIFALFNTAKINGLMSLEPHIEKPAGSAIFQKNPFLAKDHHALAFLCDSLRLMLSGGVPPHDLESLLESDIETHHSSSAGIIGIVQKTADSLPGLGIVAAVLGIIVTMGKINGPPEEIGFSVAAALVGTFMGILICYGFIGPLATHMEHLAQSEAHFLECIKAGVSAYAKGTPPVLVVEFARRVIDEGVRPSFAEVEQAVKEVKAQ
jgi:chemotaxis protein MotA